MVDDMEFVVVSREKEGSEAEAKSDSEGTLHASLARRAPLHSLEQSPTLAKGWLRQTRYTSAHHETLNGLLKPDGC